MGIQAAARQAPEGDQRREQTRACNERTSDPTLRPQCQRSAWFLNLLQNGLHGFLWHFAALSSHPGGGADSQCLGRCAFFRNDRPFLTSLTLREPEVVVPECGLPSVDIRRDSRVAGLQGVSGHTRPHMAKRGRERGNTGLKTDPAAPIFAPRGSPVTVFASTHRRVDSPASWPFCSGSLQVRTSRLGRNGNGKECVEHGPVFV